MVHYGILASSFGKDTPMPCLRHPRLTFSLFASLALAAAIAAPAPAAASVQTALDAHRPGRLPTLASPQRYRVQLRPDIASKAFSGSETIRLRVPKSTRRLVLNS